METKKTRMRVVVSVSHKMPNSSQVVGSGIFILKMLVRGVHPVPPFMRLSEATTLMPVQVLSASTSFH